MIDQTEGPYGPCADEYRRFFGSMGHYTGYHFGCGPSTRIPPPTVTFARPLTWWSVDRPQRLRAIRQMRDRFQMAILRLGCYVKPVEQWDEVGEKTRRDAGTPTIRHRRGQVPASDEHPSLMHHDDQRAA